MTPQDMAKAIDLYIQGHSVRRVAILLGTTDRRAVTSVLEEAGVPIRNRWQAVEWVGKSKIKCSVCSKVKPAEGFLQQYPGQQDRQYHLSFCKECKAAKAKLWRLSGQDQWTSRIDGLRSRAKSAGIEMSLTAAWSEEAWERQHGLCFYTDRPMAKDLGRGRTPESVSFDRVKFDEGYVPDNVVLCQVRINSIKSDVTLDELHEWMPHWHQRLVEYGIVKTND